MELPELQSILKDVQYKKPRLVGENLNHRWYIYYEVWDIGINQFVPKKYYKGINKGKTVIERTSIGTRILDKLDEQLKSGRVYIDSKAVDSVFNIRTATVIEAIEWVMEDRKDDVGLYTWRDYQKIRNNYRRFILGEKKGKKGKGDKFKNYRFMEFNEVVGWDFMRYMQKTRKVKPKTFNNTKNNFTTIINHLKKRFKRELKDYFNPLEDIDSLREEKTTHRPYTQKQLRMILTEASKPEYKGLHIYLQFLYYTGARPGKEVRLMQVEEIGIEDIMIPAWRSKNSREEPIWIAQPLERLIQAYQLRDYQEGKYLFTLSGTPGDEPISRDALYERHVKVLKAVGLYGMDHTIYAYKHTSAIDLWEATDGDMDFLKDHFRHTSFLQTEKYMRKLGKRAKPDSLKKFPTMGMKGDKMEPMYKLLSINLEKTNAFFINEIGELIALFNDENTDLDKFLKANNKLIESLYDLCSVKYPDSIDHSQLQEQQETRRIYQLSINEFPVAQAS